MRHPTDPRNGKSPPKPVHSKTSRMVLADLDYDRTAKVPLQAVIKAWDKAVREHESQGHRITEGPNFESSTFYGSALALTYTYEWLNLNYAAEQEAWDAAIVKYDKDMEDWRVFEDERKRGVANLTKDIDAQIVRAEHRLANLKAVKAREPLPFPEG